MSNKLRDNQDNLKICKINKLIMATSYK